MVPSRTLIVLGVAALCPLAAGEPPVDGGLPAKRVGVSEAGGEAGAVVTTGQLVRPAGRTVEIPARPVDIRRSPDGRFVFVKESKGITVLDAAEWTVVHRLSLGDDPSSMTGLAVAADGKTVYTTDATRGLHVLDVAADGKLAARKRIVLPASGEGGSGAKDNSFPCGLALLRSGTSIAVCLSRNNSLGVVDLESGAITSEASVGIAPYGVVLSPDESVAYVSVWGGRRPKAEEPAGMSAGSRALVDGRGVAASGGVSVVDMKEHKEVAYIETGLSASGLALTRDGMMLFVANANNDTVTVIDTAARKVVRQIVVKPESSLPFGSMPNAVALSPDERTVYAACAGNNAVAVIGLGETAGSEASIAGWIPTGWYPGAIIAGEKELLIANIKGVGSRTAREDGAFNSRRHRGSIQRTPVPTVVELGAMTAQVKKDALVPQVLKEMEKAEKGAAAKPVAIPARPGDPSTISHVIYIIKENRAYDQILGDMGSGEKPRGNGRADLCVYGREITPNAHALTERFVLLDNYYCNGVLSADGASWATEGNSTPYLEHSFGGFKRSYTYGDDPLTYSSSGFIWDHVLAAGLTFQNFGELMEASIVPPEGKGKKWADVHADWKSGKPAYRFTVTTGIENLRRYSDPAAPGWNLDIPDQVRADRFIAALHEFEAQGTMPNLITMHLPNDHTNGVSEGHPTPRAYVADNDLALGRIVEAVSHSKFWATTAMFINEDDPQDGWDHVDGHRSVCYVVSPWCKRGAVVSEFYNQAGVVHTIERIFGLTAANQAYAAAPVMTGCFAETPDSEPYTALTPGVAIDEMTPPKAKPKPKPTSGDGAAPPSQKGGVNGGTGGGAGAGGGGSKAAGSAGEVLDLYALTAKQDFSRPDLVNEREFNLVLWHAAKGPGVPYPAEFAGAHGTGLPPLKLRLVPGEPDEDDDDE